MTATFGRRTSQPAPRYLSTLATASAPIHPARLALALDDRSTRDAGRVWNGGVLRIAAAPTATPAKVRSMVATLAGLVALPVAALVGSLLALSNASEPVSLRGSLETVSYDRVTVDAAGDAWTLDSGLTSDDCRALDLAGMSGGCER